MIKFPLRFEVEAAASAGIGKQWTSQADHLPPIPCAIPPEFMGPGAGYSPEDFFALALLNCLIALFKVYCEKTKVQFNALKAKAILTADKHPAEASFALTHAEIFFTITGASDVEKARKLMDAAIKDCAVSNSIKSGKSFHIDIT